MFPGWDHPPVMVLGKPVKMSKHKKLVMKKPRKQSFGFDISQSLDSVPDAQSPAKAFASITVPKERPPQAVDNFDEIYQHFNTTWFHLASEKIDNEKDPYPPLPTTRVTRAEDDVSSVFTTSSTEYPLYGKVTFEGFFLDQNRKTTPSFSTHSLPPSIRPPWTQDPSSIQTTTSAYGTPTYPPSTETNFHRISTTRGILPPPYLRNADGPTAALLPTDASPSTTSYPSSAPLPPSTTPYDFAATPNPSNPMPSSIEFEIANYVTSAEARAPLPPEVPSMVPAPLDILNPWERQRGQQEALVPISNKALDTESSSSFAVKTTERGEASQVLVDEKRTTKYSWAKAHPGTTTVSRFLVDGGGSTESAETATEASAIDQDRFPSGPLPPDPPNSNEEHSARSTYQPPGTRPPPSYPPSFDPPAVIYHTQEFFPTPSPTTADATTPYFTENISPQASSLSTAPLPVPVAPTNYYQNIPPGGHLYVDQHVSHGNFGRDQTRPLTVYDPNVLRSRYGYEGMLRSRPLPQPPRSPPRHAYFASEQGQNQLKLDPHHYPEQKIIRGVGLATLEKPLKKPMLRTKLFDKQNRRGHGPVGEYLNLGSYWVDANGAAHFSIPPAGY
ncbi:hypothetical protein AAVH_05481 [Aphelenchoides avenae]|nr:hypothetical protein AAVH_05481 [Aphelenchus avenae]